MTVTVSDSGILFADGSLQPTALTTGTQTIAGAKTFSTTPIFSAAPAFSAYQSTLQSIPNTGNTKVQFQTEEFDTANAFDSTTNYRFTPQVAGYYQVNACVGILSLSATTYLATQIWKNGGLAKYVQSLNGSAASNINVECSALVYLNGTTDYLEVYASQNGSGAFNTQTGSAVTYFQAALVRAA